MDTAGPAHESDAPQQKGLSVVACSSEDAAFLVSDYLSREGFTQTAAMFHTEAASLLTKRSQPKGRSLKTLRTILTEYQRYCQDAVSASNFFQKEQTTRAVALLDEVRGILMGGRQASITQNVPHAHESAGPSLATSLPPPAPHNLPADSIEQSTLRPHGSPSKHRKPHNPVRRSNAADDSANKKNDASQLLSAFPSFDEDDPNLEASAEMVAEKINKFFGNMESRNVSAVDLHQMASTVAEDALASNHIIDLVGFAGLSNLGGDSLMGFPRANSSSLESKQNSPASRKAKSSPTKLQNATVNGYGDTSPTKRRKTSSPGPKNSNGDNGFLSEVSKTDSSAIPLPEKRKDESVLSQTSDLKLAEDKEKDESQAEKDSSSTSALMQDSSNRLLSLQTENFKLGIPDREPPRVPVHNATLGKHKTDDFADSELKSKLDEVMADGEGSQKDRLSSSSHPEVVAAASLLQLESSKSADGNQKGSTDMVVSTSTASSPRAFSHITAMKKNDRRGGRLGSSPLTVGIAAPLVSKRRASNSDTNSQMSHRSHSVKLARSYEIVDVPDDSEESNSNFSSRPPPNQNEAEDTEDDFDIDEILDNIHGS